MAESRAPGLLERSLLLARAARTLEGPALAHTLAELEAALEQLRQESTTEPQEAVIELDPAGFVTGWSRGADLLLGYGAEEALGQHVLFLYPDDADVALDERDTVIDVPRRRKNGETMWLRQSLTVTRDEQGMPAGMRVRLAPPGAQLSEEDKRRLRARIIEDSDQGVLITDASERIVSINGAFTRITGYAPQEAIGQTPDLLRSGVHDAEFRAKVRAAMKGSAPWRGEIVGKRKNGDLFPQSVTISVVRDGAGAVTHTFSLFSDISVHKDAEARAQRMANYDSLTGLPNRHLFNHLVDQVLIEARRAHHYGAVMVVELNRIGAISDTLGHDIASELLAEIGQRLRRALRDPDILARIEGSKFAVALTRIEKREHAGLVAQKLLSTLGAPIVIAGHSLQVGAEARVGIAVYPEDCMDTAQLVRFAEVALAKAQEGNGEGAAFLFYRDEMD